jgi:hypothetical protein
VTTVKRLHLSLALSFTLAAGCSGDPDLDEGLAPERTSVISGDAVIAIPLADPHPVVLFLAMVATATGSPLPEPTIVDVTAIPAGVLAQGGNGVRTGPFAFGLVSPAIYVVSGIVDVDENFNVLVPALATPTAADLLGGYADVMTGQLITIPVGPNQIVGEVTVMFAIPPGGG